MAKTPTIKLPSQQAIQRVLDKAYGAPQMNCDEALATKAACEELAAFFNQMNGQATRGASGAMPQASASAGGKASDQTCPQGRPSAPS